MTGPDGKAAASRRGRREATAIQALPTGVDRPGWPILREPGRRPAFRDASAPVATTQFRRLRDRRAEADGPFEGNATMRNFDELNEREILALAISNEEEDGRIYADFAEGLIADYPASAEVFTEMAAEENEHRRRLIDLFVSKFGDHIPLIRRQDIRGYIAQPPVWQIRPLHLDSVRSTAGAMEKGAARFYRAAITRTSDASIRKLLGDLAAIEDQHDNRVSVLERELLTPAARHSEGEQERRKFILQIIQPGLVGLMDGSVSTLAPVFAAAFATHNPWNAFVVGLAASVGAGISMGFAEALADDGKLSGRGAPLLRGAVCGLMTMAGGIGHTLPFLIPDFYWATLIAVCVVVVELMVISWIQWRYMDTPPLSAAAKVMIGGALVFAAGVLIGVS
jgi:rubrerythrin